MRVINNSRVLSQALQRARRAGRRIGLVPTMGALHEGHLSLIRRARRENDLVVVSIFVNPLQFAPREDLARYPRTPGQDTELCRANGVDILFMPSAGSFYPRGFRSRVMVEGLRSVLCGKARPGHFDGVTTVVAKLFHLIGPATAYFGQKDAQQALIVRQMVCDLDFPVTVRVLPIVRCADGLAMSSRNAYLDPSQRAQAVVLSRSLKLARELIIEHGIRDPAVVLRRMRWLIRRAPQARIDYLSIVSADDLAPLKKIAGRCLVAVAVWFGKTRLIDNIIVVSG